MKKTRLITVLLTLVLVAVALAAATPARASVGPTVNGIPVWCAPFDWRIWPHVEIFAADRYPSYGGETQRVEVRYWVWDYTSNSYSSHSHWFSGEAVDYKPPPRWTDETTGEVSVDMYGPSTYFDVHRTGMYKVAMEFKWGQGMWGQTPTGAAAGSSILIWEPGVCTF